uniref:Uncharacterized protein n=1 Tax=Oryza barthii TaxID=65489 RepID=A0A0D3HKA5_9ORYZ
MINKVAHFNDCWYWVMAKYLSGQSEGMQQMDKTWLMYNKEAHVITMQSESGGYLSSPEDSEDMEEGKCLVDPLDMLTKNHEDMTEVQPSVSNQKKQSELLTADALWPIEFQLGRHQLMTGTPKLNEHQQGMVMRDELLEIEMRPQDYEVLDNERVAREDEPKKETQPHQGFKARKTMLNNDREKMSEVQLRLSKEQLELARIKQDEANICLDDLFGRRIGLNEYN